MGGCYAPGGRYPLPSSVLMTALTARAAGVPQVWVASPRPAVATLAAAHIAGADGLIAIGGAQAIGAMAYGVGMPPCDVIVGPGNKWVTAAKSLVSGICGIDMLAGPSEVLVIADKTADADVIAADLLAQAEHDPDARPILISTDETLVKSVNECIRVRLATLPSAPIASQAVEKGFACVAPNMDKAIELSDIIGPNHVLPTSGTAKYTGGLSVFTFLRIRTWMNMTSKDGGQTVVTDAITLARIEGLEGHARAAECRLVSNGSE